MRDGTERSGKPPGRRWVLGLAAGWTTGLAAGGMTLPRRSFAQGPGEVSEAQKPVGDLYAALQAVMRLGSSGASFQQRFDQLTPVVDRVFDLDAILRASVGLRWPSLDEMSRRALFTVFRAFTTASYTANFNRDSGERFQVLPETRTSADDLIVETRLLPANNDPVSINYVMRSGAMGWQIVDVLLNGSISRVAVQRSDFRALLASGSAAPLIDSLRRKVADLSGGTMRL
jgi:phospholipid transport system substrate-binding protein